MPATRRFCVKPMSSPMTSSFVSVFLLDAKKYIDVQPMKYITANGISLGFAGMCPIKRGVKNKKIGPRMAFF